jgi:hypothetical protein
LFYKQYSGGEFSNLANDKKFQAIKEWDNVNAMYRKSALDTIPFAATQFAEDKLWASDALATGYKIAFDPSLFVFHYHHLNFKYNFRVNYIVHFINYRFFSVVDSVQPFFVPLAKSIYSVVKKKRWGL